MAVEVAFKRRKCIIATSLVVEIVLFSIITFVIAYLTALSAIHHASQQLADSMADTVSVRVAHYVDFTERPLRNFALQQSESRLPRDEPDYGGLPWHTPWILSLRSLLIAAQFDIYAYAMQFDDVSQLAASLVPNRPWVLENVFDARELPLTGYRVDTVFLWNINSSLPITPEQYAEVSRDYPLWASGRDTRTTLALGYYVLKHLLGTSTPQCLWSAVVVNPERDTLHTAVTCSVINSTGTFLGEAVVARDLAELTAFLQQTAVTPHTEMFLIDESYFITATTVSTLPTTTFNSEVPLTSPLLVTPGCTHSRFYDNVINKTVMSCRASAFNYPYPPLQDLVRTDPGFLAPSTRASHYRQLAGSEQYFIVSQPILNVNMSRAMQLLLFLPESDVLDGVREGITLSIVVCVLLCVISAFLSSVMVATLVGQPLTLRTDAAASTTPLASWYELVCAYHKLVAGLRVAHGRTSGTSEWDSRTGNASVNTLASYALPPSSNEEECPPNDDPLHQTVSIICRLAADHNQHAAVMTIALQHDGECFLSDGMPSVVFRTDDAGTRAVLCGLALLEARLVPPPAVTMCCGEVSQEATPLLEAALQRRTLVVAVDVFDKHCIANVFASTRHEDYVEVLGVVGEAWRCVPRHVHFHRKGASLAALLKRSNRSPQQQAPMGS